MDRSRRRACGRGWIGTWRGMCARHFGGSCESGDVRRRYPCARDGTPAAFRTPRCCTWRASRCSSARWPCARCIAAAEQRTAAAAGHRSVRGEANRAARPRAGPMTAPFPYHGGWSGDIIYGHAEAVSGSRARIPPEGPAVCMREPDREPASAPQTMRLLPAHETCRTHACMARSQSGSCARDRHRAPGPKAGARPDAMRDRS